MMPNCPRCIPVFELSVPDPDLASDIRTPNSGHVVRFGSFYRRSDSRWIRRFRCRVCSRTFSFATLSPEFGQINRRINSKVLRLLCSTTSQRDVARVLGVDRKTVIRRFVFLSFQARVAMAREIRKHEAHAQERIYFDEMESFEHSKCKPLSIPIAVSAKGNKILSLGVARMPAKGLLAAVSRKRYGRRIDERPEVLHEFMQRLKPYVTPQTEFISDQSPHYPPVVRRFFRENTHTQFKGRKGCVTGQGELKRGGFDPLFELNHTCAMLRAHISRLLRRSWVTTKRPDRLLAHLWLYAHYHNTVLTRRLQIA